MGRQLFQDGPFIDPPVASGTALVATTIEDLWAAGTFTPIFANDPKAGKIYCVRAGGIISTAASASTLIITPQWSNGGIALGASGAQTVPASLTNVPWFLQFDLVFRTIAAGTASTCIGSGFFAMSGTLATAGSGCVIPFGGTSGTVAADANGGIQIRKTLNVAGSMTTQWAYLFSRN